MQSATNQDRFPIAFSLFNSFQVQINDVAISFPQERSGMLFAYLAFHGEQTFPRSQLIHLLWPQETEANGRYPHVTRL